MTDDLGGLSHGDMEWLSATSDVPSTLDVLPDGTPSVMFGDVVRDEGFNHQQGDNPYGYEGDCGLVSCQDVLNQFGVPVNESDVVGHAIANRECNVSSNPDDAGGTSMQGQAEVLGDYGVPAHTEQGKSMEQLASYVEQGHGVVAEVNAGVLWHDSNYLGNGQTNHAITVTGVARDPQTGTIQGFYINDSGDGKSGEFVSAADMNKAWEHPGGECVVTDAVSPAAMAESAPA